LRPHVKTNKIAEVCKMMLDTGIKKFKCATIAEAEMLAMIKAPDVLLAYQPTIIKAKRLLQLVQKYPATHFSCLIDDIANAANLSDIFSQNNLLLDVYVDLNVGMNRSGIKPSKTFELYTACESLKGINITGLHAYDGHIRDINVEERKTNTDAAFDEVTNVAHKIESSLKKQIKIVAGGSPTFPIHALRKNIECSPGTVVFWDWNYINSFPDEPFLLAALVITRIISIIDEHTICTDLGHKSIAAENLLDKRVHFLNAESVQPTGQSEEHLVLKVEDSSIYKIGDVLYGVPYHICPTVALYERAIIIEDNNAVDEWRVVARDRKINI